MPDAAAVALIFLASTLIRAFFGFGDALFAMPLLAVVVGLTTATALMGLVSVVVGAYVLTRTWRHVDVASVRRLVVSSIVGIPIGVFMLKQAPQDLLTRVLGVLLIGFGLYRLLGPALPRVGRSWAYLFGFVAGCFGGAYNVNGPPVVMYGAMRAWDPARFRGTLQGYFVVTSIVVAVAHAFGGLWTTRVWQLFAYASPVVLVALVVGDRVAERVDTDSFSRYLSALLVVLGILLVF